MEQDDEPDDGPHEVRHRQNAAVNRQSPEDSGRDGEDLRQCRGGVTDDLPGEQCPRGDAGQQDLDDARLLLLDHRVEDCEGRAISNQIFFILIFQ